jgi:hypothetical protein
MQHAHTGATHSLQTTNKLSTSVRRFPPSPDSPLENPQSYIYEIKTRTPHSKTQRQTLAPISKKRGPTKEDLSSLSRLRP